MDTPGQPAIAQAIEKTDKQHILKDWGRIVYVCKLCREVRISPHVMRTHLTEHVQRDVDVREMMILTDRGVKFHKKRFKCGQCMQSYASKWYLEKHQKEVCGKGKKTIRRLRHFCDKCGKGYTTASGWKYHLETKQCEFYIRQNHYAEPLFQTPIPPDQLIEMHRNQMEKTQ